MRSTIVAIAGVIVFGACLVAYSQGDPSLQGAWRVTEVVSTGPDSTPTKNPQPGLYLFTKRHYSVVAVRGTAQRTEPAAAADPAKLTDAEKIARYEAWRPFVANAGTYEVTGGTLTMRPIVAKNPAVMAASSSRPGSAFTIKGKTLTIVQKSEDGKTETTITLTRLE